MTSPPIQYVWLIPGKFDQLRIRNGFRHVTGVRDLADAIPGSVQYQGRGPDSGNRSRTSISRFIDQMAAAAPGLAAARK